MSDVVTVGGAVAPGGGAVTIPAVDPTTATLLNQILQTLGGAATVSTSTIQGGGSQSPIPAGETGLGLIFGGGAYTVGSGPNNVVIDTGAAVSVSGGDQLTRIMAGIGGLTYTGAAGSIIASGGNNNVDVTAAGSTYMSVDAQTGNFAAVGSPNSIIQVNGNSTIAANNALIQAGVGSTNLITAGSGDFIVSSGADTVNGGAGPVAVIASGPGDMVNQGSGALLFVGNNASAVQTVMGGSGTGIVFAGAGGVDYNGNATDGGKLIFVGDAQASTVFGGAGVNDIFGGTGAGVYSMGGTAGAASNVYLSGGGAATIEAGAATSAIFGHDGSDITFQGAASNTGNIFAPFAGTQTIDASASKGNIFELIGNGNETLTGSSQGGDVFDFFNASSVTAVGGQSSPAHTITINNWAAAPGVFFFQGYGFNPTNTATGASVAGPQQTIVGGSDNILLADNTTIVLQGFNGKVAFVDGNFQN